ncbi:MAG: helix-turn-helix domain-containing protein [Fidelibacterota bacterium]
MSIQVIKKKKKADYVVIPYDEFIEFADEDLIDAAYIQEILQDPEEGEIIDFDFADHVSNPAHLVRLKAGITQKELAEKMGVTQAYISKLEKAEHVTSKALKKVMDTLTESDS